MSVSWGAGTRIGACLSELFVYQKSNDIGSRVGIEIEYGEETGKIEFCRRTMS